ncbi:type II toxin-antitoxin system PemK/MazF family toxin [Candidatus Chloroploca sp. M-50]|uniref:Type II toxin-antitoxin system PemK/MazF family toxin n=1 Tax=Candidatus Chloroploca mongolica TaxID=2528176 RepID=A0ABS4DFW8_9CHLR|nr:type II toxin-antitoxin system PemK/MazF family toxin [Candidatus Chloroploca mongolica]MBP1468328.1 type II toxin-antitoxin system PemK/MazF family toxin [Candidatus Chloroploca mongolica]
MTTTWPSSRYKRGDVVLVLFPNADLRTAKTRPVVIVQATNVGTGLAQYVVTMISSNTKRANHPSRVLVRQASEEGKRAGLLPDSVVMTDNVATVAATEITRRIGELDMTKVDAALRHTFGL